MNLKDKKIIAREFLILMGLLLCCIIFWTILIGWNTSLESKKEELADRINLLERDIELISSKYEIEYDEYNIPIKPRLEMDTSREDEIVDEDSILGKKPKLDLVAIKENGQLNKRADPLGLFHEKAKPTEETIDSLNNLTKEISLLKETFYAQEEQVESSSANVFPYVMTFLLAVGLIAYPLRFLVWSIRWSVKTLRSTDEKGMS